MYDIDKATDLLIDNLNKLFFPEKLIDLDMKMSKTEMFTILYISKKKEITMTELVEYINVPMSTATGIVDRLVKKGYIKRERSDTDRRIVLLRLTEKGFGLMQNIKDVVHQYMEMILKGLTYEEKRFLMEIVMKIINNLQDTQNYVEAQKEDFNKLKRIDIE